MAQTGRGDGEEDGFERERYNPVTYFIRSCVCVAHISMRIFQGMCIYIYMYICTYLPICICI